MFISKTSGKVLSSEYPQVIAEPGSYCLDIEDVAAMVDKWILARKKEHEGVIHDAENLLETVKRSLEALDANTIPIVDGYRNVGYLERIEGSLKRP